MAAPDSAICRSGTRAHDAVAPLSPHRSAKHRMPDMERLRNLKRGSAVVGLGGESGHVGIDRVVDIACEALVAVGINGS